MKNQRKKAGISLIVLVITIVVVIILAAAVILSLSGNNPINNARVANLDQTKDEIESSILAYSGKAQSQTLGYYTVAELLTGSREETEEYSIVGDKSTTNKEEKEIYNIDKTKFEEKIDYLSAAPTSEGEWYVDGNGKVYLVYDKKESLPSWAKNKNGEIDDTFLNQFIVIKGSAEEVANNPQEYYGKTVTNYTANGVSDWKVFHSDGINIYLISSDYIPVDKIPATKNGTTFTKGSNDKAASLTPAINDTNYSEGSASIKENNPARKWLKSYLDNYLTQYVNMRAVAYMLDIDVWKVYKGEKAEYAIGGPTIEMLLASYNNKYNVSYKYKVISANGYQISKDSNFVSAYPGMLKVSDSLYTLGENKGAIGAWVASPSNANFYSVISILCDGGIGNCDCTYGAIGFRPIVCLKSNVEIEKNNDGSVTIK